MTPSEKSKDCYRCRLARFKRMFVTCACLGSIQQAVGGGLGFLIEFVYRIYHLFIVANMGKRRSRVVGMFCTNCCLAWISFWF